MIESKSFCRFQLRFITGGTWIPNLNFSAQTEAPAITQPVNHPEKPWSTDYCIESFDVLSALTITEHEGAFSKFSSNSRRFLKKVKCQNTSF